MLAAVQYLAWDYKSRALLANFPEGYQGNQIIAHEFNYGEENQLIYDEDGLRVWSNPAFHYHTPGPVSLRLEWNGIKLTYSGDLAAL